MGAQSHTLGCAGLLFTSSRRQPCHVSPPGAEAGDMAALARSVLVTGSSRGIGLELVRQLAASPRPPQHIFATCRDPKGPRGKALQELATQHSSIKLVQLAILHFAFSLADTVNLPSIQRAMQAVGYHLKDQGLNLLINNAGISSHATLCSLDSQEMLNVFVTNVVGPLQVVKEFLPLLEQAAKAGKEGLSCSRAAVINISSKLGSIGLCLHVPEAPMYPYRASKVRCQGRSWRCCPRHGAHGGEGAHGSPPAPATHPLPGSPRQKHKDWDSSRQD
ncbi:17-beta-hydroxysteroid dehydrogenase type 6 [Lonchura striata]|uniref:17-beta-hydroxysteroid dehydrogenase type 6 n=1 Tax=Lonchura striata TaxID=40157 RepID=A0A218V7D4_9PASE|nr:17-beta-hydroxysteroid dehydrogenase type 6 [Lonchura striata domestica]